MENDDLDIEQFTEMMSAYIPSFSRINREDILEYLTPEQSDAIFDWMHSLSRWLVKGKGPGFDSRIGHFFLFKKKKRILQWPLILAKVQPPPASASNQTGLWHLCCPLQGGSTVYINSLEQTVALLCEMFPRLSLQEVAHCLAVSLGDCDNAVQLLLSRQKAGTSKTPDSHLQDEQLREQILNRYNTLDLFRFSLPVSGCCVCRYGYIDQDEDCREHRPVAPKAEPKKLIRYRESKIVSVKGERFSEIKREESDDLKKTYVTLKPARQYRFH
ncbi:CUEDC2 [Cordylochernes scorpioides]|uniref:CUEDC2 n=1 Tax=Cordylochernes scorpioides TaxID=51811 RepID=A0ABY6LGQ4_9ARAC|nr:CUEDC2 [Cordylochernes scorpioides]